MAKNLTKNRVTLFQYSYITMKYEYSYITMKYDYSYMTL